MLRLPGTNTVRIIHIKYFVEFLWQFNTLSVLLTHMSRNGMGVHFLLNEPAYADILEHLAGYLVIFILGFTPHLLVYGLTM